MKGRTAAFLSNQENELYSRRVTIIIDEAFHEEVVETVSLSLKHLKVFDLDPYSVKEDYIRNTKHYDNVKMYLSTKHVLDETDRLKIDCLNKLDMIRRMPSLDISEEFNNGNIIYNYLGRLDLRFLSSQANIQFLVLDACGEKDLIERLVGIELHKVIEYHPTIPEGKVDVQFIEDEASLRVARTAGDTLSLRRKHYLKIYEEANKLYGRQRLELSGITNKDLADRIGLKGHFKDVAGKNFWEYNDYLIIYGLYYHSKPDLDLKAAAFIGTTTKDF